MTPQSAGVATGRAALAPPTWRSLADVATTTGPFDAFDPDAKTLVTIDLENLVYSARDLHRRLRIDRLAEILRRRFSRLELHACFSLPSGDRRPAADVREMGWTAHTRPIIEFGPGPRRACANADVAVAFHTAALLAKLQPEACIIGTGDGCLALDIARATRAQFSVCKVVATASIARSTSHLLDARREPAINGNIEIGLDVMTPLTRGSEQ